MSRDEDLITVQRKVLYLSGKMSIAAKRVVTCRDLVEFSSLINTLTKAVDDYDMAIIEEHQRTA